MKVPAMIFAAGLGTRLYPLTVGKPKALVEINGKSLLEITINKLISYGIEEIVVNIHHFGNQITDFLESRKFNAHIHISDETKELLDTAGGLKFAENFFAGSEHILLHNVDIISSINLSELIKYHIHSEALATLAVKERISSRYFVFEKSNMQLCGWKNTAEDKTISVLYAENPVEFAFSGIHIVRKELLGMIPAGAKKSLTPLYLELIKNFEIKGYLHNEDSWMDIGKYEEVKNIAK